MNYDFIFDSTNGETKFNLATGHISTTSIYLKNEKLYLVIDANGSYHIFDESGNEKHNGKVIPQDNGRQLFEEIFCSSNNKLLTIKFPIYEWIDNYPHCDGEHDRWDTKIIDFNTVTIELPKL